MTNKEKSTSFGKLLKLNHPCEICKKEILIGDGTIIKNRPLHFECYKKEIKSNTLKEFLEEFDIYFTKWTNLWIRKVVDVRTIRDLKGFKNHILEKQHLAELGGVKE